MDFIFSLLAIVLYLSATALMAQRLFAHEIPSRAIKLIALVAIICHGLTLQDVIFEDGGIILGIEHTLSLTNALICLLTLAASHWRPVYSLMLILFPLAALAVGVEMIAPSKGNPAYYPLGVFSHIVFSILAYSGLTLAAIQAIVLAHQDRMLRDHQLRGLPRILPPLQTMESMLFEVLWVSMTFLTLAIVSGALYVDDMLAQHLAHKTVFSILAWLVLGVLLWGRSQLGWRGRIAIRWTLIAFSFLLLGFLGTKVALQLIIH
ncbi:cytochrome c biogenesis protein CcsA [Spongiibacter sp. KMU-158]|uniref:Cytochrome c biogenesis protein CcsA n=1 Tax=Spongiibacter pelagi TaxID=2760804 RepID=A0A927C5A1_9GAMM|nr:cytochrome c biogenesis protein CcsA [Spongiibacter pelagi]MBD2860172.1 cytochrome c biogenesis protein CcsA [Spongiibacter pelagi]